MRRKPGSLVPLELAILDVAAARSGPIHGFELAKALAGSERSRTLTSHGTLYKALGRLAAAGLLEAEWEAPDIALSEGRPRRRLYRITGAGARRIVEERASRTSLPARAVLT